MEEKNKQGQNQNQPDNKLAAEERPVPSQAEGDLETVEEDLKTKQAKPKQKP